MFETDLNNEPSYGHRFLTLSFDDKSLKIERYGSKTVATLHSYFKISKLEKYFKELGFDSLPQVVIDILEKNGYKRDYKLNGWVATTIGITTHDGVEEDNQIKANRIALCRAKVKAYEKCMNCSYGVARIMLETAFMFNDNIERMYRYYVDEGEALDRVIETGYCKLH